MGSWLAQVRARWTGPMASWERADLDRLLACAEALDGLLRLRDDGDPLYRAAQWQAAWERARAALSPDANRPASTEGERAE